MLVTNHYRIAVAGGLACAIVATLRQFGGFKKVFVVALMSMRTLELHAK